MSENGSKNMHKRKHPFLMKKTIHNVLTCKSCDDKIPITSPVEGDAWTLKIKQYHTKSAALVKVSKKLTKVTRNIARNGVLELRYQAQEAHDIQ